MQAVQAPPPLPCVLVVDDNADAAEVISQVLMMLGARVQVAHGGTAALELAQSVLPDLILMDIRMPDMDGYATSAAIRSIPGLDKVPIFAISGWTGVGSKYAEHAHLFNGRFDKPINIDTLARLLRPFSAASPEP